MTVKHLVENVRDIALVGHRAAGKTSLADALLFEAHAVDRMGSVDDGTSVADFDEEEHKHHFSIDTHVLHADHDGKHLNILDAPGSPDFIGAALEALSAVETAVVVVSAVNGIEMNTRRMFTEATNQGLSRAIVINKIDAEKVDLNTAVEQIRASLGKACVLFNVPDQVGPNFSQVFCLLDPATKIPDSCPVDVDAARSQLIEAVVESDEALLEKYLSEGTVSVAELEGDITRAMEAGTLVPIFCASAKKDKGVKELLDALCRYGLSPTFAAKRLAGLQVSANGTTHQLQPTEQEEFVAQVFKVVNDKFVGHLSFVRVLAGKLQHNHNVVNLRSGQTLRVGHLLEVQGKNTSQIHEVGPGDIVAIAKVEGLEIGDTIAYTNHAPKVPPPHFPTPMFGLAIEPKTRGDEQKISVGLHKLASEDPTVKVVHDQQTHELVISGVSQLHLDIIRERLKARFGVEVNTKEPKIPYRETINGDGAGDHKHKKQTGGRGQLPADLLDVARDQGSGPMRKGVREQEQVREDAQLPLRPRVQLRVHRPHRRRDDPQQLHPRCREGVQGDARTRRTRGLPHPGLRGRGPLREVPRCGLVGSRVQDRRSSGLQEGLPLGATVTTGTHRQTRNHCAGEVHRSGARRLAHQARPRREPG
jgi:elongation factor G